MMKCKMCGSDLLPSNDETTITCPVCGSIQTIPNNKFIKELDLFEKANDYRLDNRFDEANKIYKSIIKDNPDCMEAYWCSLLCDFGIQYTDDIAKERKIPTCNRTMKESIFDHPYYKFLMDHASQEEKDIYQKEANEIERIQKQILELANKNENYDIFICYKEKDLNKEGNRTIDSQYATLIYESLVQNGYKVFLSRITLKDVAGESYEPYIYSALQSSKVMILVGSSYDNITSPWVRNEWSRYIGFMQNDLSKGLVPCLFKMDAYELPDELQPYQALNIGEVDFNYNLLRSINRKFNREEISVSKDVKQVGISKKTKPEEENQETQNVVKENESITIDLVQENKETRTSISKDSNNKNTNRSKKRKTKRKNRKVIYSLILLTLVYIIFVMCMFLFIENWTWWGTFLIILPLAALIAFAIYYFS